MSIESFAGTRPILEPERYFAGHTRAWGMFEDRFGKIRRTFEVVMKGDWDGETLTLDEHFTYDDGAQDRRIWRIRRLGEGRYEGRADDVVGVATGLARGRALSWRYDLRLPIAGRDWVLRFDDLMLLQEDGTLLNVARVSKYGIAVGRLTLAFHKRDTDAFSAAA